MRLLSLAVLAFLLLGAAVLLICGCDDPIDLCGPQVPAGSIQGSVRTGGLPIDAVVSAKQLVSGTVTNYDFRIEPDEQGRYALDLPAGRYVVQLLVDGSRMVYDYTGSEPGYGNVPADTLLVDSSNSHAGIDFDLGGVTLQLELSDHLDGETGMVILHLRDAVDTGLWQTYVNGGSADIENGRLDVRIAGVLPGEYQVEIVLGGSDNLCCPPYDGELFWMPGTRDRSESPWYTVAVDSVVALQCSLATESARIAGRVVGAWLEMGLERSPELSIFTPDSQMVWGPRGIEDDGSFGVDLHFPGPVKLRVAQYGVEQWFGGPGFDDATVYMLELGQTVSDLELVQSGIHFLWDKADIIFYVDEIRFYDPIALTLLTTYNFGGHSNVHIGIPNLWPGEFLIYVTPGLYSRGREAWRPQWWDRMNEPGQAQWVSITSAGQILRLDLKLEIGGTISGQVESISPIDSNCYVYAVSTDENYLGGPFQTYVAGGYNLRGLPDGDFKIGVGPGLMDWIGPDTDGFIWYPGTPDWQDAAVVEIRDASNVAGIDFFVR